MAEGKQAFGTGTTKRHDSRMHSVYVYGVHTVNTTNAVQYGFYSIPYADCMPTVTPYQ